MKELIALDIDDTIAKLFAPKAKGLERLLQFFESKSYYEERESITRFYYEEGIPTYYFLPLLNFEYNTKIDFEEIKEWSYENKDIIENLRIDQEMVEAIKYLMDKKKVVFISNRIGFWAETEKEIFNTTMKWLSKYFNNIELMLTKDKKEAIKLFRNKYKVSKEQTLFIDDKIENLLEVEEESHVLLVNAPWNQKTLLDHVLKGINYKDEDGKEKDLYEIKSTLIENAKHIQVVKMEELPKYLRGIIDRSQEAHK